MIKKHFLQIMILLLLLWVVILISLLVLYLQRVYSTFSRHGIKHFKPLPILGNMGKVVFRLETFAHGILNIYNSFPDERFVGRFEFFTGMVVIRDVELVKKITVKDFEYFVDHRNFGPYSFFGRTMFLLQGQEWKDMRSTLSPAFTSSKIRLMVPFMVEIGDQMIHALSKMFEASEDKYIDVDCKDLTTRYFNDVIASCAFGLKVDSYAEKNNQFYVMGNTATNFNFRRILLFFLLGNAPEFAKIFKLDIIPDLVKNFFTNLVLETMENRETHHIIRPDMIHLLMEAKKGKLFYEAEDVTSNNDTDFGTTEESSISKKKINREWSDSDIVAQAFLFFFAGFETVSSSMSFLMYELAVNPDIQERLVQEIREHDVKNGGKIDFNSIQHMTYMDMVISEVFRRWPPNSSADRICNKDYNLGKPNETAEKDFVLPKGSAVMIPTYAFHHDPQFFPEPEKFDPERFSEENKHKINPFAYMPFGIGPRNCIGTRFALCELKVMTYLLLLHTELSPCEKTCIPAKLATDNLSLTLVGGHWLRLRLRY